MKYKHRFEGISYYFSVTETKEYMETIRFMENNINKSLTKYQNGITLDQVLNAQKLKAPDTEYTKIVRIQIIDQKLYLIRPESESWLKLTDRVKDTLILLLDILKIYHGRVPDVDFVISTVDQPPLENLNYSPILTFNKYKGDNNIAIPFKIYLMEYVYAFGVGTYFKKSYNFRNKIAKAVWRGANNGDKRMEVYRWTLNHTDLIDFQLVKHRHTGNYMSISKQEHLYKYLLDIDGAGWSSRFIQSLNTDMVIIKENSSITDFCNEMLTPDVHYLTFSNESTLVKAIQYLIDKGDDFALNMIRERKKFAKRYCSRDAQMMYMFTVLNMYAKLQTFQVVKDSKAVYLSNDSTPINYLELLLMIFVLTSAILTAFCCAQNFRKCIRSYKQFLLT